MAGYEGPRRIVILGGGIAGLACADAITAALEENPGGPAADVHVTLVEGESFAGGRATSFPLDGSSARHPYAPSHTSVPHGIHFVWGSYAHTLRLCGDLGVPLSPATGTPTYGAWLAPPDVPGDGPARVVAVHVCDPARPEEAWQEGARAVLRAVRDGAPAVAFLERFMSDHLGVNVEADDTLSYMDILFDEQNLAPELRWTLFLTGALWGRLGMAETSPLLRALLDGRNPTDVDIGELWEPVFTDWVLPRVHGAWAELRSLLGARPDEPRGLIAGLLDATVGTTIAVADDVVDAVEGLVGRLPGAGPGLPGTRLLPDVVRTMAAVSDLLLLLLRDVGAIMARPRPWDPRSSGYLKNVLKAAFSSPYGLDVATAVRDAQFGLRNYEGALLRVFDGDDSRAMWEALRARVAARFSSGAVAGEIRSETWCRALLVDNGAVSGVELTARGRRRSPDVPATRPVALGRATDPVVADAVVSTLLPQSLARLLPATGGEPAAELTRRLHELGRYMNETINLQLFFPARHELPFPAAPPASSETPPFSISNLEGPFTIIVDLGRCWSRQAFESIRLADGDNDAFAGTAWELVGNYPDLYTHDARAHRGRRQWPLEVQQELAALLHDPDDFVATTIDTRPWLHDADAPGRLDPPVSGEVKPARAADYERRWRERATPLIVSQTLRQLATMPGMARRTSRYLREQAEPIGAGQSTAMRFTLVRNCHAENRFFSAEPGLYSLRPHARFETSVRRLWAAGDWTRNGLNVQAMEPAVISGLQAAAGVLERMRAGGLDGLRPPLITPAVLPDDAWDVGG